MLKVDWISDLEETCRDGVWRADLTAVLRDLELLASPGAKRARIFVPRRRWCSVRHRVKDAFDEPAANSTHLDRVA